MRSLALGEIAQINPRAQKLALDTPVSFVGMAQLDADSAVAKPLDERPFSEVVKGYTQFRDRDILVAKITPCWENGKVGTAELNTPFGSGSTEFHVIRPSEAVNTRYLLHFLRTGEVRHAGELRMTGSGGQRRIPPDFFSNLLVPLPDLAEQRRIAVILDQADAIRAKRNQAVHFVSKFGASLFAAQFGACSPNRKLADFAEVQGGLQVSSKRVLLPVEVPYLRVANSYRGHLDLAEVRTLRATPAEVSRTSLAKGDLLVVEGHASPLEIGRVSMWEDEIEGPVVHQNHLIRVRVDMSELLPEYVMYWLNSPEGAKHLRRSASTTSGLNTISSSVVKNAPIYVPPLHEQDRFVGDLRVRVRLATSLKAAQAADDELFASLQARAFKGEL